MLASAPVREKKDGVAVDEEGVAVMAAGGNTLPLTGRWALEPLPLGGTAITNPDSAPEAQEPCADRRTQWADIKTLGGMLIFLNFLQTFLSYVNEFYADRMREENGIKDPKDMPMITLVLGNIFNGLSGGLAISTALVAGGLMHAQWWRKSGNGSVGNTRCAFALFVSVVFEAVVTSGVLHSIGHRVFGLTLLGNAVVEFVFHLGFTVNTILNGALLLGWLAPAFLAPAVMGEQGEKKAASLRAAVAPRWFELVTAIVVAVLAALCTELWAPFNPRAHDFNYSRDAGIGDVTTLRLMQGTVQQYAEAVLLVPSVLFLFTLRRLWMAVSSSAAVLPLQRTAYRHFIVSVAVPLLCNWIHFRGHDSLVHMVQTTAGWEHSELIAALRILFHFPIWVLSIGRFHYLRRLVERNAGWRPTNVFETLWPGGEALPFLMMFIFRMSEGMTFALLPMFFQGGTEEANFHLNVADNAWIACTVLVMFLANAVGSIGLGRLMQTRGYDFLFKFACVFFIVVYPLHMLPHTRATFLALRCVSSLLFPGPIVLTRITQNTRHTCTGPLEYMPMAATLIYFNQGFAVGGAISNSQKWTPSNVFFTSFLVLTVLMCALLGAFLKCRGNATLSPQSGVPPPSLPASTQQGKEEPKKETKEITGSDSIEAKEFLQVVVEDTTAKPAEEAASTAAGDGLALAKATSFANGASFACHIALLGIQVTGLVRVDKYEYSAIVSSLGTISTVLLLLTFGRLARSSPGANMLLGYSGHCLGTAVLGVPAVYRLPRVIAIVVIALSYSTIFLSFYTVNLACEVSLKQASLRRKAAASGGGGKKDAAAGKQMGLIKASLSFSKACGVSAVIFAHHVHPCLPLWILEGGLLLALVVFAKSSRVGRGRHPSPQTRT